MLDVACMRGLLILSSNLSSSLHFNIFSSYISIIYMYTVTTISDDSQSILVFDYTFSPLCLMIGKLVLCW